MIPSMNAAAAGQPANTNLVQLRATPPALSADDVGANNLMGLMLRPTVLIRELYFETSNPAST
jgi:hypothetical protein